MKKVKKINQKHLTEHKFRIFEKSFERNMQSIAKSFADNAEVMALILKELRVMHEDNKFFRETISSLNIDGLSYDKRINNLTVRMEKLEPNPE